MINKENPRKMYYFSQKLKKQLEEIPRYPLTVVEAPSGFGKTTAVREYLKENLPQNAMEYWYTCLGEPASIAWRGICELLANVNSEIAANLRNLELPTMETLLYMTTILRDFHCKKETYLVIDNYQLVKSDIPREIISVFAMHGNPNLHMIFITQQLRTKQWLTVHNTEINTIDSTAFFFDREGTLSLFRMEGIRLGDNELESVFRSTEGWVSAIRLQILNYKENGSFDLSADIEHLVETAIWKRLTQEERDFLLSISIMESFTARQAAVMIGKEMLPENLEELLKSNDFIRYHPDKNHYAMHSILQDYLRNRFYHHQPEAMQTKILRLAGEAYALSSMYYQAAQFFFRIKDYDAIFSLPLEGRYILSQKENNILGFMENIVNKCPEETFLNHPFEMLMYAYWMLIDVRMNAFHKLNRLITLLEEKGSCASCEDDNKLRGEILMLKVFASFNNVKIMAERIKEVSEILDGSGSIINDIPWAYGSSSILALFLNNSGSMDEMLYHADDFLFYYHKVAKKHCTGVSSTLRAEAYLMRGEDADAEIMCRKALYEARNQQQTENCIRAETVLANIAVLRGDADGYFNAVSNIKGYVKDSDDHYAMRLAELCLSGLSLQLGLKDDVVQWLNDMESIQNVLYTNSTAFAFMYNAKILLMDKRYSEFFGISQILMNKTLNDESDVRFILPHIYHLIYLSVAKHNCGNDLDAQKHLIEALSIALPDQIYLPFAQQDGLMDSLMITSMHFSNASGADSAIHGRYEPKHHVSSVSNLKKMEDVNARISALKALCKRYDKGACMIKKAILQTKSVLTPREREVAQFAKDRFSAKEIAEKLFISEATVRTILRNVYSKLDVHSKSELNAKEF